jgi:predicted negative regulator of RcsB-dependent stress response
MRTLLISAVLFASLVASGFASGTAHAQVSLKLPDQSPAATVTQTVGLTEITVVYHRPGAKGRPIWGALVPYNEPWRAGANENTTITLSNDVKVGGKPLRAGTYGLHMIPTAKDWTVAFSTQSMAWGSFTYDPKEDALRVTVTPRTTPTSQERLLYRFDDPGDTKTTLVLAWEKLEVPIAIEIDTPKVVMASVRNQLRGLAGNSWQGFNQAANYWLRNGGPLDEALKLVDKSIQANATFPNLMTRAAIVEKQGNAKAAAELRAKALPLASENELIQAGYRLLNQDKKVDEAIKLFQTAVDRHPESWNAHDSLAEGLVAKGDKQAAVAEYNKALSLAKEPAQKKRIEGQMAKLK